jgi:hypothetical protein
MFAFLKAVALGIFLALIVSLFIGSGGSDGGMLNVRAVTVQGYQLYWSWALFLIGTGLSFVLFLLME